MAKRFINDTAKLRVGGRKAPKMSISELQKKLWKYYCELEALEYDEESRYDESSIPTDVESYAGILTMVTNGQAEDLEKDLKYGNYAENVLDETEDLIHWIGSVVIEHIPDVEGKSLLGFHTLSNGFSFLGLAGVAEGSDFPMFSIFYYDGKKVRGYTPTRGNYVNTDTKTAFYMEEYAEDFTAIEKRFAKAGLDYDEADEFDYASVYELDKLPMNFDAIKEEIEARIVIS